MVFQERIQIIIETITKGAKNLKANNQTLEEMVMSEKKLDVAQKSLTGSGRGLTMTFLSVMFFGQMVKRTMQGLLQPAMDAAGIFEILSDVLTVFFLPIILELLPKLLEIMEWFLNLDPEVQKAIGAITLLTLAFGGLLAVIGSIMLPIVAVGTMLGGGAGVGAGFAKLGGLITGALGGISAAVLVVAAIVLAIIIGMILAWQENFAGFKDWLQLFWDSIGVMIGGALDFIKGIWQALTSLLKGDTEGFVEGLKKAFKGLINFIGGLASAIFSLIVMIGIGAFRALLGILKVVIELLGKAFGAIWENLILPIWNKINGIFADLPAKALQLGIDIIKKIVEGIKSVGSLIWQAIMDAFGKLGKWLFGGGTKGTAETGKTAGDFIWRPGSAPIAFSPTDTIVGTKTGAGVGGFGGIVINQTLNIGVSNAEEMQRMIADNNSRLVDDIRRITKGAV